MPAHALCAQIRVGDLKLACSQLEAKLEEKAKEVESLLPFRDAAQTMGKGVCCGAMLRTRPVCMWGGRPCCQLRFPCESHPLRSSAHGAELSEVVSNMEAVRDQLDNAKAQLREKTTLLQEVLQVCGELISIICQDVAGDVVVLDSACYAVGEPISCHCGVALCRFYVVQREADRLAEAEVRATVERSDSPRSDGGDPAGSKRSDNDMMKSCVPATLPLLRVAILPGVAPVFLLLRPSGYRLAYFWLSGSCFSRRPPPYEFFPVDTRSFKVHRAERGPPETVLCARCHAIISELSEKPDDAEGADGAITPAPVLPAAC
jgi:hypothetical protein